MYGYLHLNNTTIKLYHSRYQQKENGNKTSSLDFRKRGLKIMFGLIERNGINEILKCSIVGLFKIGWNEIRHNSISFHPVPHFFFPSNLGRRGWKSPFHDFYYDHQTAANLHKNNPIVKVSHGTETMKQPTES